MEEILKSGYMSTDSDSHTNAFAQKKTEDSDDDDNVMVQEKKIDSIYSDDEKDLDRKEISEEKSYKRAVTQPSPAVAVKPAPIFNPVTSGRCEFVPMRLTEDERKLHQVLENALEVCEYTDMVDVTFSHTGKSKTSRIFESLVDVLSISCGLIMANNLTKGEQILSGKSLNDNITLFTDLFEIGRRYKIMNPAKMRNTYGKLMYILMDTESYSIKNELKINFVKPILTVSRFLKLKNKLDILNDELFSIATRSINNIGNEKSARELELEIAEKKKATDIIILNYACDELTAEDLKRVIDSISDNEAFLEFNMRPVDRILTILKDSFDINKPVDPFSLQLTMKPQKKKF